MRGNGTKIAPTGYIFDQPPGGMSWVRGKLAGHVEGHVVLSPEEGVLVTSPGTESSYPRPSQLLNNSLPLTLSLTSRLAPRARLTVDVPTRAFWLAGIFLRRKKRCAGVVGTRTDWVLKGEEGGMTTLLLQYVARFDGGARFLGLEGEVTRRAGHGAPCLSNIRLYLLRQAARNQLYGSGRERS